MKVKLNNEYMVIACEHLRDGREEYVKLFNTLELALAFVNQDRFAADNWTYELLKIRSVEKIELTKDEVTEPQPPVVKKKYAAALTSTALKRGRAMNEADCLSHLISPGTLRIDKSYMQGVIQILVTSSCDQNCYNCTQLSQLRRKPEFMSPEQFEQAVLSLKGYFGVYGTFGGNPCLSPHFKDYCEILKKHVPFQQRGLWSNNPIKLENAKAARDCYNPAYSNINVHLNQHAFDMWKQGWPECRPIGLSQDSRHSPCFTAMKDLDNLPVFNEQHQKIGVMENTEENRHTLISDCDIAKNWSAAIGMFRGQLRGFFCEIALAQAIHHQDAPDYSDTGLDVTMTYHAEGRSDRCLWWQLPMQAFAPQVRTACHSCGVPLRGHGENAMANSGKEQVSRTHATNYEPKRKGRTVELVTELVQLGVPLVSTTNYLGNSGRP